MSNAHFISIEGIDGAGKTTQARFLKEYLEKKWIKVHWTREPGGTPVGEKLRAIVLGDEMKAETELMLFFAARVEHIESVIKPCLVNNEWVISDRFSDATYAYQVGGKGLDVDRVHELERVAIQGYQPDRTYYLDMTYEQSRERLLERARAQGLGAEAAEHDRFEKMGRDFFERVRAAYLARCDAFPERILKIDANDSIEAIHETIIKDLEEKGWL
ncbi:MAG: dTMP kinase [Sutterella sp.]|nr:dTMP kinase [Sutterella sp.]